MIGVVIQRDADAFHVRIAGLLVAVESAAGCPLRAGADHEPFLVDPAGGPADMRVRFRSATGGWEARGSRAFSGHDVLEVYDRVSGPGRLLVIGAGARLRCEAVVSDDWSEVDVQIHPWDRLRSLHELPRAWETSVTTRLARLGGGFLVHAAGLIVEGIGGVLVAGSSGRGKSTLSSMHALDAVLSDERVAVAAGPDGAPWIHGTPWRGTAGRLRAASAPLRAIAFLGPHEGGWALEPLDRGEVFRRLAFHAFPPFWDAPAVERALDLARAAACAVPGFHLQFCPEPGAPLRLRHELARALSDRCLDLAQDQG